MISKPLFSFLLFIFIVYGCSGQRITKLETRDLVIESSGRSVAIKAEIARTTAERSRGLMHRTELADGEGMLFVFDRDESFHSG